MIASRQRVKHSSHAAQKRTLAALVKLARAGCYAPCVEAIMLLTGDPRRTCYRAMEDLEHEGYISRHRIEVLRDEYSDGD